MRSRVGRRSGAYASSRGRAHTRPAVGRVSPATMRSNVDFSEPFGPVTTAAEPAGTRRSSPSRTHRPSRSNRFLTADTTHTSAVDIAADSDTLLRGFSAVWDREPD